MVRCSTTRRRFARTGKTSSLSLIRELSPPTSSALVTTWLRSSTKRCWTCEAHHSCLRVLSSTVTASTATECVEWSCSVISRRQSGLPDRYRLRRLVLPGATLERAEEAVPNEEGVEAQRREPGEQASHGTKQWVLADRQHHGSKDDPRQRTPPRLTQQLPARDGRPATWHSRRIAVLAIGTYRL